MSRAITGAKHPRHAPRPVAPVLPFGMEGRARGPIEGDDARTALYRELNFFPTPPWAARAGGELIQALDPHPSKLVWEPACGEGHLARALIDHREACGIDMLMASDVHPYGYGSVFDFTDRGAAPPFGWVDWVVTNPPFARAEAFVERGLKIATRGVAMLCRLAFVESVGRHPLMTRKALSAPFAERVPMQLGSWNPDLSSATAYAWFVWLTPLGLAESPFRPAIEAAWAMGATLERIIPPGTCDRLTRPDDRVRFAGEAPHPQMELL